jgi:hypothetical protein
MPQLLDHLDDAKLLRVGIGEPGLDRNPIEDGSQVGDDFARVAFPGRMKFSPIR